MITKIDHLGIAVRSLDEAVPYYEKALGLKCEHREEVASQKVRTAFFSAGETHIELLEPTSPDSPIAKFLEKNPSGGVHHVAFGTADVEAETAAVTGTGVRALYPEPRRGTFGSRINFLHPKDCQGILTELIQSPVHE